jgi:hypothetical protein
MSEAATLQAIRLGLGREPGLVLWRNNTGAMKDHTGRLVRFGLHPGSSDLIGFRSITVTADMVGQRVAIFAAIEVKDGGRLTAEQRHFIDVVSAAGGFAGMARNPGQARMVLGLVP